MNEQSVEQEVSGGRAKSGKLFRQLGPVETAALSIALMSPTAAMALNGSLTAATAGTATALAFLGAAITMCLVAYAFVTFAKQYATAGSVYTFNGRALGARVGFLSGWALLLVYVVFAFATSALVGLFVQTLVTYLGGGNVPWVLTSLAVMLVILIFGVLRINISTSIALTVEGASICVILVLFVVIVHHGTPTGFTLKPFLPGNASFSQIALASIFAFLSLAGFEASATLGEESKNPRVAIPRAIWFAVLSVSIFFVGTIYVQAEAFGLSPSGVQAFATSSSPLSQLAANYSGSTMAALIAAGAAISAFGAALASTLAAARLIFTMGRDRLLPPQLSLTTARAGSPWSAILLVVVVVAVGEVLLYALGVSTVNAFGYTGTIGTLALLLVYITTQVSAIYLFGTTGRWRGLQFLIPTAAILLLGYAFYANVYPIPALPYNIFPYLVIGWILVGLAISFVRAEQVGRVAVSFAENPRDSAASDT